MLWILSNPVTVTARLQLDSPSSGRIVLDKVKGGGGGGRWRG